MKKEKKFPVRNQAKSEDIRHPQGDHYQTSMSPEFPAPTGVGYAPRGSVGFPATNDAQ